MRIKANKCPVIYVMVALLCTAAATVAQDAATTVTKDTTATVAKDAATTVAKDTTATVVQDAAATVAQDTTAAVDQDTAATVAAPAPRPAPKSATQLLIGGKADVKAHFQSYGGSRTFSVTANGGNYSIAHDSTDWYTIENNPSDSSITVTCSPNQQITFRHDLVKVTLEDKEAEILIIQNGRPTTAAETKRQHYDQQRKNREAQKKNRKTK